MENIQMSEETQAMLPWREKLKAICQGKGQKQAVAQQIGTTVRTLDRWIRGEGNPQTPDLIRNLARLNNELRQALEAVFPGIFSSPFLTTAIDQLPPEFPETILTAYRDVPAVSRRWTIFILGAKQMIPYLDQNRDGLMMLYVRANGGDLLFEQGAGNTCWTTRQFQQPTEKHWLARFVQEGTPLFVQSCAEANRFPPLSLVHQDRIQSMCFLPYYRGGIPGGGLLLCSGRENFFSQRQALLELYACLLSLGLSDADFQSSPGENGTHPF